MRRTAERNAQRTADRGQRKDVCCAVLTPPLPACIVVFCVAGGRSFLLPHATTSDSELFDQILAIDRGEQVAGAVEGVLPDAAATEAAAATAAPAEPKAASA